MASKSIGSGKKGPRFTKGGEPGPGRPPGSHDSVPRSVKAVCKQILEEDGDKVREAILLGLAAPPPASAPYVKLVVDHGLGKPVDKAPERDGRRGVMVVLAHQLDPLRERAKPWKDVDLTLGSGQVIDAEPVPAGAPAKSPVPAPVKKALPPGPLAATAGAAREATAKKITTPEHFAEAIPHARRMEGSGWAGDCPACGGRQTLTWGRDAAGRAAEISCEHDCALEAILDGARTRLKAARARDAAAAVRTVKLGAQDMVCASDAEPEYLLEVPSED